MLYFIGVFIGSLILILPGLAIWIYGIYNAYKVAQKVNLGQIPYKDVSLLKIIGYIVLYFVICFGIVIVLTLFSAILAAFIYGMTGSGYSSY